MPDLVMGINGRPDVSKINPNSEGVYQGNGWKYEIGNVSDTLTLESGQYDFNYTSPGFSGSRHFDDCDHLSWVNVNNIVVQQGATIVGGMFKEIRLSNYGTVENGLFSGTDVKNYGTLNCLFKSKPFGIGYHSLTAADNSTVEVLLYSFVVGNEKSFYGDGTIYFTGTPKLTVKLDENTPIQYINGETNYGGLKPSDVSGYYTFTPKAGEDVVLNLQHYDTDLVMTPGGIPVTTGREPIYQDNDPTKQPIGYKGEGWKYENGTLTLESGSYDFTYIKPRDTASSRDGYIVRCNIVVEEDAKITGGIFTGSSLTNSGTVEDILFTGSWITNNNGTLSCLLSSRVKGTFTRHTMTAVDRSTISYTVNQGLSYGFVYPLYFTGTPKFTVKLQNSDIHCINGDKYYGGLKPSVVSGYYTFTPPKEEDIVLNREPYVTDLVMTTDGIPDTSNAASRTEDNKTIWYGTDWTYDGTTLTLESGSYDFTYTKPSDATSTRYSNTVRCNVVVNKGAAITGGKFSGDTFSNSGTVKDILFMGKWITNNGTLSCLFGLRSPSGTGFTRHTMTAVDGGRIFYTVNQHLSHGGVYPLYFTGTPKFTVKLENSTIHHINGRADYGGLTGPDAYGYYTFTPEQEEDIVLNDTIIHEPFTMTNGYPTASNGGKTACKGEGWEYILGDPEHGDFLFLSDAQIDFSKISDGSPVECKLFIGHGVAVKGGTFNGKVINNGGGILGGTFNGAVENHGTIENGVFNGAVTNIDPGTVSNSITGTGTLNGKPITPNAYTLTVTGGGLVNRKTSAVVKAGEEVRLTTGEMQEGMSFNYWDLPTPLLKALTDEDSTFSNKVESLTFTMPDLSEYTEDTRFTIRLDIRPAELPDDDDGPSVLGTMATVAVGGAAAGILVWQGVSLGVDSYLQLSLPGGVPVPANRIELVKLLWETAGKPDVVLPALYGDVSAEDAELQKATRWAIANGLVKPADDSDASRFDPDRYVTKYDVFGAWLKLKKLMK